MESKDIRFGKGMHSDASLSEQPEGTYPFALNAVSESLEGDSTLRSNEPSANIAIAISPQFVIVGSVNMSEDRVALFLYNPNLQVSEIGIFYGEENRYEKYINDLDFEGEFNFGLYTGVRGVWRKVRGYEDKVYFTTPQPMVVDFSKNSSEYDSISDFFLFKSVSVLPSFKEIRVTQEGQLLAGSYNIAVQLLDEDFNPTEWLTVSHVINIYHDNFTKEYKNIEGSSNEVSDYRNFGGVTNKAIVVTLGNLDSNFIYYRLALVSATSGSGIVSQVRVTGPIPLTTTTVTLTGTEAESTISQDELRAFNTLILSAKHITQLDDRLVIANIRYSEVNFCNLQHYASRITSDCITKRVDLSFLLKDSNKWPTLHYTDSQQDGTGYMPGELYSFGIVYQIRHIPTNSVFDSPAYHIPGRPVGEENTIFGLESFNQAAGNIYPMRVDNTVGEIYTDNNYCEDYWGTDHVGNRLQGTYIRHHRFPYREDFGISFIEESVSADSQVENLAVSFTVTGDVSVLNLDLGSISVTIPYTDAQETIKYLLFTIPVSSNTINYTAPPKQINITDVLNGEILEAWVDTSSNVVSGQTSIEVGETVTSLDSGLTYTLNVERRYVADSRKASFGYPLGIKFSNIEKPQIINPDYEVVGYQIVRQERTDQDKSVMDSAVTFPIQEKPTASGIFEAAGIPVPAFSSDDDVKEDVFGFINPYYKFTLREDQTVTRFRKLGEYAVQNEYFSGIYTQDVGTGTSYNPEIHKRRERDDDGFDLNTLTRDVIVNYQSATPSIKNLNQVKYLNALEGFEYDDSSAKRKTLYNVSSDNRVGVAVMTSPEADPGENKKLRYGYLERTNPNSYSNFRLKPYYKETQNVIPFNSNPVGPSVDVYHGDVYISPLRYFSSQYHNFELAKRATKKGFWNIVLGAVVIAGALILAIPSGGTSLFAGALGISGTAAAGVSLAFASIGVSFGLSSIATGITKDTISKVYQEQYEAGLRDVISDEITQKYLRSIGDDLVCWQGQSLSSLWFESPINMGLRQGNTSIATDFLAAPSIGRTGHNKFTNNEMANDLYGDPYFIYEREDLLMAYQREGENDELDDYLLSKLTVIDFDNSNGYLYKGFADAEIYSINIDYLRTNKQKEWFQIPLEYDCCSNFTESFPHRVHSSEKSFSEELSDNFRVFLPNNYVDLPGETGVITGAFKIKSSLYIHTEEALWKFREDIQERITDEVVSFIGTGEFLSLPPEKVTDDAESSAGTRHDWATIVTRNGVFFISEKDRKIYLLQENSIKPISDLGEFTRSINELGLKVRNAFHQSVFSEGDIFNAPFFGPSVLYSNILSGYGFIAVYDYKLERYIFSKHDAEYLEVPEGTEVWTGKNEVVVFENYGQIIGDYTLQGYYFKGIRNGKLQFVREISIGLDSNQFSYEGNGIYVSTPTVIEIPGLELVEVAGTNLVLENRCEQSITKSFSMKNNSWTGYHSWYSRFFFRVGEKFWSSEGYSTIWEHNNIGSFGIFYGKLEPFVIELVYTADTRGAYTWENIGWQTFASKYNSAAKQFVDKKFNTFTELIAYNNNQSTGLLKLKVKDLQDSVQYLTDQIINFAGAVTIDKNEKDWTLNHIRDMVVDYNEPLFISGGCGSSSKFDKVPNDLATDVNKEWYDQEMLRDRFLAVRFFFDNFGNIKLVVNYQYFNVLKSLR